MTCDHLKTKQLAKKIRARKQFLNQVVGQIINLVGQYGWVTKRDQENYHTNVVTELRNFGNFTFETNLGQTDFGGDAVKVWYHPGKNFREGGLDFAWDKEWIPVLDVYFQEEKNYDVYTFKKSADWQKALLYVLKNKAKVAAQIQKQVKKDQEKKLKTLTNQEKNDANIARFIESAKKLGIIAREIVD